ncbi:hypothetical protein BKA56DRAFT_664092 [Ilyonectria sp. MPI-CAGE-AT-0026]|nr:hypothetical protein BKA56DRAFT_664092 [Ilyonectria sp. MPI-CAGE-AT-0026]
MDSATSPSTGSETSGPEPVKGKDIFWILIALAVLSSIHPLGTGCGLPPEWRRYARVLPFSSLLDTIHLLKLVHSRCKNSRHLREVREKSRALIEDIVFSNIDDQNWRSPEVRKFLYWAVPWMLDIRPRTIVNALVVLQYVKFYGYHGVPLSFAFGTAFFVAWIGLELVILFAYGFSAQRPGQHHPGPFSAGILREPASKKRFVGYVVLSLQLVALALLGTSTFMHISISMVFRQLIHMFDPIRYVWRVANKGNRFIKLAILPLESNRDLWYFDLFSTRIPMSTDWHYPYNPFAYFISYL